MNVAKALQAYQILTSGVPEFLVITAILYVGVMALMARRIINVFEPAHVYLLLAIMSVSGLALFRVLPGSTWSMCFWSIICAFVPFLVGYGLVRRRPRPTWASTSALDARELRLLSYLCIAIVTFQALAVIVSSGFQIGGGGAISHRLTLLHTNIVLTYTEPVAVSLIPLLIWLQRRNMWLVALLTATLSLYLLKTIFLGSRAALFIAPLMLLSIYFYKRLDQLNLGLRLRPLLFQRSYAYALAAVPITMIVFSAYAAMVHKGTKNDMASVGRLMMGFDDAIFFSVADRAPDTVPPYCVVCSYVAFSKFINPAWAPEYPNLGIYYGRNVLGIQNINKIKQLALPNSTMPLEFLYSYGWPTAPFLIIIYSGAIVLLINWAELHRYRNIRHTMLFGYLYSSPLLYILDGNSFILGLDGLVALYGMLVVVTLCVNYYTAARAKYAVPLPAASG